MTPSLFDRKATVTRASCALSMLVACYAFTTTNLASASETGVPGRTEIEVVPDFSVAKLRQRAPYKNPADFENLANTLRKVGLPE